MKYLVLLDQGTTDTTSSRAIVWQADRTFEPTMPADQARALRDRWRQAVDRAKGWEPKDNA